MATSKTTQAGTYATAPAAGLAVVNDHRWDVAVGVNGDLVKIGELPAFHRLAPELCSFYAIGVGGNIAAATYDIFIPSAEGDAKSAANTLFDNVAVVANTPARTAVAAAAFLLAEALGVAQVNRPIYLDLQAAPATAVGIIKARIASFPDNPTS
jgi:hypothetical protein